MVIDALTALIFVGLFILAIVVFCVTIGVGMALALRAAEWIEGYGRRCSR